MFLEWIFGKAKKEFDPWRVLVDDARTTAAGITVSPVTAMRCPAVYAGARVRSEVLGMLPLSLFKRLPNGGKEKATAHRLHTLLHDRANPWTAATDLITALELDCITHGSGYALANRVGGKVQELIRLEPGTVTLENDRATLEPTYKVVTPAGTKSYGWQDVLHVTDMGGLSPVKQCADAIGLYVAMERHAGRIFANGGRPSGVLTVPTKLANEIFERVRNSWNASHAGESSGKTAVLEGGVKFEPLAHTSVDMQFLELRAFQLTEIARALGVPPALLQDYGRATWGNSEQMAQQFLTFTVLPRAKAWQGAVARLLSATEQRTYFAEFNTDELVKADVAARFEAYAKAIASRILSPNEVRAKENLPPYQGGDAYENPNTTPSRQAAA